MSSKISIGDGHGTKIEIRGLKELQHQFAYMEEFAQIKMMQQTLKRAAQIILVAARKRSPKSSNFKKRKGNLRGSYRAYSSSTFAKIYNNAWQPNTKGYYAAVHEWGGDIHPHPNQTIHIKASHMITGAVEENREEIIAILKEEFDKLALEAGWK
jgi:HK97 gp10 family phage protein